MHCIGDVASETIGLGHAVIAMGGTIELLLTLGLNMPTYSAAYHDAAIDGLAGLAEALARRASERRRASRATPRALAFR